MQRHGWRPGADLGVDVFWQNPCAAARLDQQAVALRIAQHAGGQSGANPNSTTLTTLCARCSTKRLRYFMQRDGTVLNMVLRIFLRVIAQSLQSNSPGAAQVDKAALHIGAIAIIHRFGSSLNGHVHFYVCVVDGVFEAVAGMADGDDTAPPPEVILHAATPISERMQGHKSKRTCAVAFCGP